MVGAEKAAKVKIGKRSKKHTGIVREIETQVNHPCERRNSEFDIRVR